MGFLRDGEIHAHPASVQHLARHNAAGFFRVLQLYLLGLSSSTVRAKVTSRCLKVMNPKPLEAPSGVLIICASRILPYLPNSCSRSISPV